MQIHGGDRLDLIEKYNYTSADIVDFSSNINPWGPPASVLATLRQNFDQISRYPDLQARHLIAMLSQYLGIAKENITLGNGSSELIYLLPRSMKIKKALIVAPTFIEYQKAVSAYQGEATNHIMNVEEASFNQQEFPDLGKFDAVFLCNPNNPTGCLYPKEDVLLLANKAAKEGTLLIIDESFIDFVQDRQKFTVIREAAESKNILVLGSMGKFFSLAGLRLGYVIANKEISIKIGKTSPPWNVNSLAQIAGIAALQEHDFIEQSRSAIIKERDFLIANIGKIRFLKCYPSCTNFILIKITTDTFCAIELADYLASNRILIRKAASFVGLDDSYFRIAVLDRTSNLTLLEKLENFMLRRNKDGKA